VGEEDTSQVDASGIHHYLVKPGFIYFTRGAAIVTAVLGNSVSVCLWDKKNRQGGMNNFLYPFTKDKSGTTAKYGNVATVMLIKMMEDAGSFKRTW
jgi:chemotaxis protein CheD